VKPAPYRQPLFPEPEPAPPPAPLLPGDAVNDTDPRAAEAMRRALRIAEALLFAAPEPVSDAALREALPAGVDLHDVLRALAARYADGGVNLARVAGGSVFRTAPDLAYLFRTTAAEQRRLSRAALETLAIIAYHQPVTRAEIEEIRGVAVSRGTLDVLMEAGFVRLRGRRRTPGRPITLGTTTGFLAHFGLSSLADLPALHELQGMGLLDAGARAGLGLPIPADSDTLREDEDPLAEGETLEPLTDGEMRPAAPDEAQP
jgi:segregation and condensation protein B